jgi:hypothetical protein
MHLALLSRHLENRLRALLLIARDPMSPAALAFREACITELEVAAAHQQSAAEAMPRSIVPFSARFRVGPVSERDRNEFQLQPMIHGSP